MRVNLIFKRLKLRLRNPSFPFFPLGLYTAGDVPVAPYPTNYFALDDLWFGNTLYHLFVEEVHCNGKRLVDIRGRQTGLFQKFFPVLHILKCVL